MKQVSNHAMLLGRNTFLNIVTGPSEEEKEEEERDDLDSRLAKQPKPKRRKTCGDLTTPPPPTSKVWARYGKTVSFILERVFVYVEKESHSRVHSYLQIWSLCSHHCSLQC